MKKLIRFMLVALLALSLTGCMYVDTLINVKKDGSGTVEQTILMSKAFTEMMKQMMAAMGSPDDAKQDDTMPDKAELEKSALKMGKGVKFKSVKAVHNKKYDGFKAIYSFRKVSDLLINQNPEGPGPGEGPSAEENIVFKFSSKGKNSTLTIIMPEEKEGEDDAQDDQSQEMANQEEEMDPQMKQMFADMFMRMQVKVAGKIVKSNATHRKGSTITLFEMDFGEMVKNEEKFKEFTKADPKTMKEAQQLMKDMPGIKVEMEKQIKVVYK